MNLRRLANYWPIKDKAFTSNLKKCRFLFYWSKAFPAYYYHPKISSPHSHSNLTKSYIPSIFPCYKIMLFVIPAHYCTIYKSLTFFSFFSLFVSVLAVYLSSFLVPLFLQVLLDSSHLLLFDMNLLPVIFFKGHQALHLSLQPLPLFLLFLTDPFLHLVQSRNREIRTKTNVSRRK